MFRRRNSSGSGARGNSNVSTLAVVAGIKPWAPSGCDYYEILGVDRTATADAIRKAYLQLSMKNHPDKNPGDEAAKRRFQQISEAYQVLSDPKLRSKYDATGSVDGIDFEDAAAVFTQLFGSPKFDVYIGRLRLASMILLEGDQDAFIAYEKQRLADLVLNLKVIISQYTLSDDLDMFVQAMATEAEVLAKEQHGRRLLYILGRTYVSEAQIVLTNFLQSNLLRVRNGFRGIGQNFKSMSALVKTAVVAQESARMLQASADAQAQAIGQGGREGEDAGGNANEEQLKAELEAQQEKIMMQVAEKALPLVFDTVWSLNTQEITTLAAKVVRGVLHEKNIGGSERRKRAIAIYELGRIFKSYKNDEEIKACPDAASLIADIEKAMRNVMAQGDDRRDAA